MEKLTVDGVNDVSLSVLKLPAEGKRIGVVHILHGMAEHKERYKDFMTYLSSNHFTVYAHDHRGHGHSLSKNQEVGILNKDDTFEHIVEDVHKVQAFIAKEEKTDEIITIGHSMGSLILRRFLQTSPKYVKTPIIMGTLPKYSKGFNIMMLGIAGLTGLFIPSSIRHKLIAKMMNGGLAKTVKNKETAYDWLSVDQKNVKRYIKDPLSGYAYNKRFYTSFFKTIFITNFKQNIEKTIDLPCLFISGYQDPLSKNMKAIEKLKLVYDKYTNNTHQVKGIYGARHEILNEKNNAYTYEYLLEYIKNN